ncbi:hypothetical protein [Erythrobacter sp. AP23]|uniref:hypothetical protein n=1 Tax=Erythrobacter sp. AP23 TaxID=499656 RepID=UPI00076D108F|nr:hypothetical protein [Erythrobacter sp. AP23]KWV95524.1 hypothetical protein ASS64_16045 [Erythrobacter sp. AP23]
MSKDKDSLRLCDFQGWKTRIRKAILAGRRAEQKLEPQALLQTEWGATRFHLYRYYRALDEAGFYDDLVAFVGPRRGPKGERVGHLLRLINKPKALWNASTTSRISKELELALQHDINPKLVLGFLSEVGNQQRIIRCYEKEIRPEAAERYTLKWWPVKSKPTQSW